MLIAAIHIPKFHFFNNQPTTINFGGFYFYSVDKYNNISREENKKYVDQFYSTKNLKLITAIVGKNGIGKTTTIDAIIDALKRDKDFYFSSIIFYEDGNITYLHKNLKTSKYNCLNFDFKEYNLDHKIIYYSPYISFKDTQYGYLDLSLDNIINEDFNVNKDLENDLYRSNPIKSHQYANDLRFVEFRSSKLSNIIDKKLNIPSPNGYIISFNDFKINYDNSRIYFHNTPDAFRVFIQKISDLIEKESNEIVNQSIPQVEIQLKLMKNYFNRYILQQFIRKMEELGDYLYLGRLPNPPKTLFTKNKIEPILIWFLKNHSIQFKNKRTIKPLPIDESIQLISYFQKVTDTIKPLNERDKKQFDWDTKTIIITKEQALNLLRLQNNYIVKLSQYFGSDPNNDFDSNLFRNHRIHNLMNFEYSLLKLSSGEISLLNLFSRLYSFFQRNFDDFSKIPLGENYFIFLDEGDSGFHPEWKKNI